MFLTLERMGHGSMCFATEWEATTTKSLAMDWIDDGGKEEVLMRRYHVLIVGVVLGLVPQASSEEGPTPAQQRSANQANQRAERLVNQQLNSIQQRLAHEEKRIESRLKQLANQREVALKKEDTAALKRIEKLEKQAISNYDAQVSRIIKASEQQAARAARGQGSGSAASPNQSLRSVPKTPSPPQTRGVQAPSSSRAKSNRPTSSRRKEEAREESDRRDSQPRRRFRLWPF